MSLPVNETCIQVHIRADSLASLRDQLQKALDEMGFAPQQVAQAAKLAELVAEAEEAIAPAPAPAPDAVEKPRRTRKAKEEAPAVPAADPTSSSPAPTAATVAAGSPDGEAGEASAATSAPAPSPSTPPAGKSSGPTHEQAKAAAEKWMAAHPDGPVVAKQEVRGILATFGVSKVAELSPTDIPGFLSELDGDV